MKKRLLKYAVTLFTGLLLLTTSCDKWIDEEINVDPDAVTEVPLSLILSSVQVDLGYVVGDFDFAGTTAMWMQYIQGTARQAQIIGNYNFTEADVNNGWSTFYDEIMMDAVTLINQADEGVNGSPHFKGVAQVCLALSLGISTDLWNEIPYSEAFLGSDNLKPSYDSQEEIYATIDKLLTDAVVNLNTTALENDFPLTGDAIYGGTTAQWIKAANALRARYELHKSQTTAGSNWNNIIAYCGAGMAAGGDDMVLLFGSSEATANPLYQYIDQRGDVGANSGWVTMITGDPRAAATTDDGASGVFGSKFGLIDSPVAFMTYAEQKFIEAEAQLRKTGPDAAAALAAYKAAVTASLDFYGVLGVDAAWETANITDVTSVTLKQIAEAKYKHLFCQVESYNNFRRTGFPALAPVAGTAIPTRWPYPTSERLYNTANVPTGVTLFSKVWWDN